MNTERIESLFKRRFPRWDSGINYPRQTGYINLIENQLAINWGCFKAEQLANKGCFEMASAFLLWAHTCYHPYTNRCPWSQDGANGKCGFRCKHPGEDSECNKRTEVRILRAIFFLYDRGGPFLLQEWVKGSPFPAASMAGYFVALSRDEWELVFDSWNRGLEPSNALWPKRRKTKSKYLALMAAAQTIGKHEAPKK